MQVLAWKISETQIDFGKNFPKYISHFLIFFIRRISDCSSGYIVQNKSQREKEKGLDNLSKLINSPPPQVKMVMGFLIYRLK